MRVVIECSQWPKAGAKSNLTLSIKSFRQNVNGKIFEGEMRIRV